MTSSRYNSSSMSSWLAFHMMGFYPNAGQGYYLLHAPLLKQAILHQDNGTDFKISTINFSGKNHFVKSVTLNKKPLKRAWLTHEEIINGGDLVFEMDSKPSDWGANELPPAKLKQ